MNRRHFLSTLAAAGSSLALRPSAWAQSDSDTPLRIGLIGSGWFGGVILDALLQCTPIESVALCDPNAQVRGALAEQLTARGVGAVTQFADFRKLLEERTLDVVVIATPDHWHALPAIAAMQAGADLILEKPIATDVIEGAALVAAAQKYGTTVQVNLQRRTLPFLHEAKRRFIESGRLGKVAVAETYCYLGMLPRGSDPAVEPPTYLDYDLWSGPAPLTPYRPTKASRGWRSFKEYGNGIVGDMGVHMIDVARMMLDLGWPQAVSSTGGTYQLKKSMATVPDTQLCIYEYPDLRLTWEHRAWGRSPIPGTHWTDHWGARFIGENGTLNVTSLSFEFTPAGDGETEFFHLLSTDGSREKIDFSRFDGALGILQKGHVNDFLAARAKGTTPGASIEQGHVSTACSALANLALELGRPLAYDPETHTVRGDDEATALLRRPYRAPWTHPEIDAV